MLFELIFYDLKNYFAKISLFRSWHLLFILVFITNYLLFDFNTIFGFLIITGIVIGQSFVILKDDYNKGIYLNYMIANIGFLKIIIAKITFLFLVNLFFLLCSFLLL